MGISAYMDRPGPMEIAGPPANIGYDRIGGLPNRPDLSNPNTENKLREYMKRGLLARQGIETLEANVDPSDWRVIQQIMSAGGNPDDYVDTAYGFGNSTAALYEFLDKYMDFENVVPDYLEEILPFYEAPERDEEGELIV